MANNQPTAALSHLWWSPDGVNLVPVTATNPLPVTTGSSGGGTSSNFGASFPSAGTAVGFIDASGNMAGGNLDASGNLKVSGSLMVTPSDMLNITGTISSAAVLSNFPKTDCTGYFTVAVEWTTVTSGNTAVAEWSNDGTTWTVAVDQLSGLSSVTAAGSSVYNCFGKQFRLRCSVFASGSVAANAQFRGEVYSQVTYANLLAGSAIIGKVGIDQTTPGTTNGVQVNAALPAGTNVIGHVITDSGSTTAVTGNVTVVQGTGTNLHAVIDSGSTTAVTGSTSNASSAVATSSTNVPNVSYNYGFNGTTWDQLQVDGSKLLKTVVSAALPAGSAVIGHVITDSGSTTAVTGNVTVVQATGTNLHAVLDTTSTTAVTQATASSLNAQVVGVAASGAAVSGNPVQTGARAATANPSAVSDGQVVLPMTDKLGKQVVVGAVRNLVATQKTSISNSTAETTIVTAIASTFCDVLSFVFANSGSSTTKVDIRDTTGGSIITTFEVPATDMRGIVYHVALPQTTVNTNWTAQCGTATTALEVTVQYVKNI